jgi:hypothetical protein
MAGLLVYQAYNIQQDVPQTIQNIHEFKYSCTEKTKIAEKREGLEKKLSINEINVTKI